MTADHGICPLPEVTAAKGIPAKRLPAKKLFAAAEEHLRTKFDKNAADPKTKSRWIESVQPPWAYLNYRTIEDAGLKSADVAKELAKYLTTQEGVYRTFTRADLAVDFPVNDPIGQKMKNSFFPDRCGDVGVVSTPYYLIDSYLTGTNHGTPHSYDTYVPLLFYGQGIKPGVRDELARPQTIASVLAQAAGIKPPKMASYPAPDGLFK